MATHPGATHPGATPPHETFSGNASPSTAGNTHQKLSSASSLPRRLVKLGLGVAFGGLVLSASVARAEPSEQLIGRAMVLSHQDLALIPDVGQDLESALQRSMEMQRLDQLIEFEAQGVAERVSLYRTLLESMGSGPLGNELSRKADQLASYRRVLTARSHEEAEVIRPRKRNIANDSLQAVPVPSSQQAMAALDLQERACRNLLFKLGDDARSHDQLPTAFRVWGRALRMDTNGWAAQSSTRQSAFLDAAVFMITSARASDEVQALFEQLGLDTNELDRRTIAQMERWLTLYAQAPTNLTSFGGTRQTLTDMLYLLGDDTGVAALLPDKERTRLLSQLATSAAERGQYAEAVGAWTRLQDTEALKKLGRKLSKNVLVETDGKILVQREVALAVEALAEADDTVGLQELLARCRAADARVAKVIATNASTAHASAATSGSATSGATTSGATTSGAATSGAATSGAANSAIKVVGRETLTLYVAQLTRLVEQGAPADEVIAELARLRSGGASEQGSSTDSLQQLSAARLEELIQLYSQQAMTLPGEQRRDTSETLKGLEEEAMRRNLPQLALTAALAREEAGMSLVALGGQFLQSGDWELAYKAYQKAGKQGIAGLRSLGDRLTQNRTFLVRGAYNSLITVAVNAYLEADAVDRLEPLYMDLQLTRNRLSRTPDPQSLGIAELDEAIKSIQAAYELEAQLIVTPPAAAPATPSRDVASSPTSAGRKSASRTR